MTYDRFNLFEAYTNQTLPEAEQKALEDQLRTDDALKAELLDYQKFRHSLDTIPLRNKLDRIHNRLEREGSLEATDRPPQALKSVPRLRRQRLRWSALAVVLLIGVAYWFTRPNRTEQVFLTYYQPEPVSRGEATCSPNLMPAIQAYRASRYEEALDQFTALPDDQPCVAYYVGLSQLALGQSTPAIRAFESALKPAVTSPPLIRQKAEWYLALAYLKANRPVEAKRLLVRIAQQPDQPFRTVARRALSDFSND